MSADGGKCVSEGAVCCQDVGGGVASRISVEWVGRNIDTRIDIID